MTSEFKIDASELQDFAADEMDQVEESAFARKLDSRVRRLLVSLGFANSFDESALDDAVQEVLHQLLQRAPEIRDPVNYATRCAVSYLLKELERTRRQSSIDPAHGFLSGGQAPPAPDEAAELRRLASEMRNRDPDVPPEEHERAWAEVLTWAEIPDESMPPEALVAACAELSLPVEGLRVCRVLYPNPESHVAALRSHRRRLLAAAQAAWQSWEKNERKRGRVDIVRRRLQGRSHGEIAEELDISVANSKVNLSQARKRLLTLTEAILQTSDAGS